MKIINDKNAGEFDTVVEQRMSWPEWKSCCAVLLDYGEEEAAEFIGFEDGWFHNCYMAGMLPYSAVKEWVS